jgi:hypothetical protein
MDCIDTLELVDYYAKEALRAYKDMESDNRDKALVARAELEGLLTTIVQKTTRFRKNNGHPVT